MNLDFLPLAITMMVGPGIMADVVLITAPRPVKVSAAFVAALPLLAYLLFSRRAKRLTPKVRDWMNANSWLVNIIAYVAFIMLILL